MSKQSDSNRNKSFSMKDVIEFPVLGSSMVQQANYINMPKDFKDLSANQFSPKRNDETMLIPLASRRENTFINMQEDNTVNPSIIKIGHKSNSSKNMLLLNQFSLKPMATIDQQDRLSIIKSKGKLSIPYSPNLLKLERSGVETTILEPKVRLVQKNFSLNENFILGKPDTLSKNSKEYSLIEKEQLNHSNKISRTYKENEHLTDLVPKPIQILPNCEINSPLSSIDGADASDNDNYANHSHSRILESCRDV